jgi:hypothetical protein
MNKTLTTDFDLFAAALSQVKVTVVQRTANDIPVMEYHVINKNTGEVKTLTHTEVNDMVTTMIDG